MLISAFSGTATKDRGKSVSGCLHKSGRLRRPAARPGQPIVTGADSGVDASRHAATRRRFCLIDFLIALHVIFYLLHRGFTSNTRYFFALGRCELDTAGFVIDSEFYLITGGPAFAHHFVYTSSRCRDATGRS